MGRWDGITAKNVALVTLSRYQGPMPVSELLDAICARGYPRAVATTAVWHLKKAGDVLCEGAHKQAYRYSLAPGVEVPILSECSHTPGKRTPRRACVAAVGEPLESSPTQQSSAIRDAEAEVRRAEGLCSDNSSGGAMVASVGTVCQAPENPSQGRIEDAIASIMELNRFYALEQLFALLPRGWARAHLVSGLGDAVLQGWCSSTKPDDRTYFRRTAPPPGPSTDPLAMRFAAEHVRKRVQGIATDLDELLADHGNRLGHDQRIALGNCRQNLSYVLKHVDF